MVRAKPLNEDKWIQKNGMITKRYCPKCKTFLDVPHFNNRKDRQGNIVGLQNWCVSCNSEYAQAYFRKKGRPRQNRVEYNIIRLPNGLTGLKCQCCHQEKSISEFPERLMYGKPWTSQVCRDCTAIVKRYYDKSRRWRLRYRRKVDAKGSPELRDTQDEGRGHYPEEVPQMQVI